MTNKKTPKCVTEYQTVYKELQLECNKLKRLIESVDPLDIDFNSKVQQINNLKLRCNQLHYQILKNSSE